MQHLAFDIGGGFTQSVGNTGRYLDNGWNVGGGLGWNFTPYIGAMVQTNYNSMGFNSSTLSNIGVPGGGVHIFSATIDPIVHLHPHGHFDPYIVGGGGLYHEYQNLTAPTLIPGFFGFYPGQVVLSSYSVNKPGANIGAGIGLRHQMAREVLRRSTLESRLRSLRRPAADYRSGNVRSALVTLQRAGLRTIP